VQVAGWLRDRTLVEFLPPALGATAAAFLAGLWPGYDLPDQTRAFLMPMFDASLQNLKRLVEGAPARN
jgi:hypothetical protein